MNIKKPDYKIMHIRNNIKTGLMILRTISNNNNNKQEKRLTQQPRYNLYNISAPHWYISLISIQIIYHR